ncbi:sugar ABC transporter substrate-binding protein [Yanshouia hominis]|uniref:Sugar ABC transporter substrate-binding protein n=1 Tax=Yanshouia hominis TaxID=2763673 RepID=A0ABR7NHN8_9FIRM|nr:sugar ABC transporter substrate-binding protein [Yanshouia hominis]MBC8575916.1 sugar ABC transporter substrate-binding protein [Yanshouia hominis]
MKKALAMLLAMVLMLSLAACGQSSAPASSASGSAAAPVPAESSSPAAAPASSEAASAPAPSGAKDKYLVGVNMGSIDQSYYAYLRMGLEQERKDDVELYVTYHEWDLTTQIKQIEDFVTMGCDLIVMVAADPNGILPAMSVAKDAGIPIIEMDCPTNYFPDYSIGQFVSDDYDAGYQCGKAMAEAMNGEGVVQSYVITATVNSQKRLAGFCEAISEYPGINNVYNATEKFDATTAQTIIENMLLAHPETTGLFTSNDKIASAAVNFFKANNIKSTYLCHVAAGTRDTVYTWLNDGWDYACYDQNPVNMGAAVMRAIYDHFETGAVNTEPTIIAGEMRFAGDEYICDPVYYD